VLLNTKNTYIVIDAGNTQVKIAVFKQNKLSEVNKVSLKELFDKPQQFQHLRNYKGIISSVLNEEDTKKINDLFCEAFIFDLTLKLPIQIKYETPQTLGKDRIANAVAGYLKSKSNTVIIDIGTCVKFDFVSEDGNYQGGSISPGIDLRYKSLNDYTAHLPILSNKEKSPLIGRNTNDSLHSGVINGLQAEINQLIYRYNQEFNDLTFFVTGGDAKHFDFPAKSNIFANENLTLEGLYQIVVLNER
jgi:type III pantothenate kinase